jgi:ParB/RepB/Spo0J family partition protein
MARKPDETTAFLAGFSIEADDSTDIMGPFSRRYAALEKYPIRSVLIADIIQDSDVQFRVQPFDPEHNDSDASLLATMGDPNVGLLQPIMVQEIAGMGTNTGLFGEGKKYKMVFGHNRRDAAKMLGWEKISAHVAKPDEDVSHFTFVENNSSKPQSAYERAMTLRKYADLHPLLTHSELAEKVGMERTNASRCLKITDTETPKPLVDLFARGLAINAAIALKPIFMVIEPSSHDRLAELLDGISERMAAKLSSAVVEQKIDPFDAVEMFGISSKKTVASNPVPVVPDDATVISSVRTEPVAETVKSAPGIVSNSKVGSPAGKFSPAPVQSQSEKTASRLPTGIVPDHDGVVTKLAEDNGSSKFLVKKLIIKARTENLSYEELNDACLISARCENADIAVTCLVTIMADARAFSAFSQYAKAARLALRAMAAREKVHDFSIVNALQNAILTPLPLVPESPVKKK